LNEDVNSIANTKVTPNPVLRPKPSGVLENFTRELLSLHGGGAKQQKQKKKKKTKGQLVVPKLVRVS